MNIFDAAKAYFAAKRALTNIEEAYKMDTTTVKPGWKTTEFWGKVAVQVFGVVGAIKGFLPVNLATLIVAGLEGVYSIARAVVKFKGGDLPDVSA